MPASQKKRFLLVHLIAPPASRRQAEEELTELQNLVNTYGGAHVVEIIQRRSHPDGATYIGSGKAQAIASLVGRKRIDTIVINAIVNPTQLYNIQKLCWEYNPNIEVWDRIDLILHIFENHASSAESKLQIRLASMRHMGPRMYGLGIAFSQQGGGIGTRGLGETNVELMKRHWRGQLKQVEVELSKIKKHRERQIGRRKDLGLPTISIVGYTNAGKTTLFNLLTNKQKLTKNILFATLDSTVGTMYFPQIAKKTVISDTIGFIQNLPPTLIDSFRSTLMESIHANILLHVIDAADQKFAEKIKVVESILDDLSLQKVPKIYVFNKVDLISKEELLQMTKIYSAYHPCFISVTSGAGIKELYYRLQDMLVLR
jgi:GTPase